MSSSELRAYSSSQGDDVRILREFDRAKMDLDNALMATNLMISRAESDLKEGQDRKKRLLNRLEFIQRSSSELYWDRLITWATTGRVL